MQTDRPNILVIQADQLAANAIGAYHNPVAKTPNIDSLAAGGAVFDAAYTNFPLCAPSRFSMMSGQLASTIGAYDNGAEFPASIPTLVHYLRHLGYQTCLVGKMHFIGPDQLHGFEQRLTTDIYPGDFCWTGDWTEVRPKFGNDVVTFTDAGICKRNVQIEYDDEVCHRARRKLYDLARARDERPFLLFTSFTHPHDPFQCRQEHWDRFAHDDIGMPTVDTAQADMDPYSLRLIAQYGLKDGPPSPRQVRVARHAYYGSVSYVDDLVGELLAVLKDTGLLDNTVILLTTDHGELLGEHGLWYKKSFFEDACRIPLIVSHPQIEARRIDANVSLVDLLPTLLEIAGDEKQQSLVEEVAGQSLWPLVTGSSPEAGRPVYAENLAEGATTPLLMVKRGRIKYVYSAVDKDQLFDLEHDPHETINQIDNPDYAQVYQELSQLVQQQWDAEALAQDIVQSQRRRRFLRQTLARGTPQDWDFAASDELEQHCLRSDRVYSNWAYEDILGYRFPEE
ncbi:MAG: choline-sulfatase [Gammaproteobacteria bacterium]|nr:MAG: choline-sulfatase [Gammaproteobacteria bacterium]UCH41847.1 MAG: choline-sulfatase [Gammaproteobacteria bacterium]